MTSEELEAEVKHLREVVARADLLAAAVEMGLESDHATIQRTCHYYRTGVDAPVGSFVWPTRPNAVTH